ADGGLLELRRWSPAGKGVASRDSGRTRVRRYDMNTTEQVPPAAVLRRMTSAYWTSQAIYVTTRLGIPDLLANRPQTSEALAAATDTHAPSLYRLLRAVASLGLLEENETRQFTLTPMGRLLRSDVSGSMRAWTILLGEPWFRGAWDNLLHSVRTGNAAFEVVHGAEFWAYLGRDAGANALFNDAMSSVAPIK